MTGCHKQANLSLRCLYHRQEHLWGAKQIHLQRSAWHHLSRPNKLISPYCNAMPLCLIGTNFILQQDNDPRHCSKIQFKTYSWNKHSAGILSVMDWPAQSRNAIQLLWEQLDRMVRIKCPSSQSNLRKHGGKLPQLEVPQDCNCCKWRILWTKLSFQAENIISDLVSVLAVYSIHFTTSVMNNSRRLNGKMWHLFHSDQVLIHIS